jgi:hypothetical protein
METVCYVMSGGFRVKLIIGNRIPDEKFTKIFFLRTNTIKGIGEGGL